MLDVFPFLRILIIFSTWNPNGGANALCLTVSPSHESQSRPTRDSPRTVPARWANHTAPNGTPEEARLRRKTLAKLASCQPKKKPAVAHPEFVPDHRPTVELEQPISFPTMNTTLPPRLRN